MSSILGVGLGTALDTLSSAVKKKTGTDATEWSAAIAAAVAAQQAAGTTGTTAAGGAGAVTRAGAIDGTASRSTSQEFLDYMSMSPREKLMTRLLAQLGISKEEYEAMPPDEKARVAEKIEEQMKKLAEIQGGGEGGEQDAAAKVKASMVSQYTKGENLFFNTLA